jgi:predicted NodU family carbamoyl transferase
MAAPCLGRAQRSARIALRHQHIVLRRYFGRDYDGQIDTCLRADRRVRQLASTPAEVATDLIQAGKAGASYTGRMEYGPRALGARYPTAHESDSVASCRSILFPAISMRYAHW